MDMKCNNEFQTALYNIFIGLHIFSLIMWALTSGLHADKIIQLNMQMWRFYSATMIPIGLATIILLSYNTMIKKEPFWFRTIG